MKTEKEIKDRLNILDNDYTKIMMAYIKNNKNDKYNVGIMLLKKEIDVLTWVLKNETI